MISDPLDEALTAARQVLDGVVATDLDRATPCASWTVADVLNHVIGGQRLFAAMAIGEAPAGTPIRVGADDYRSQFEDAAASSVEAFRSEAAAHRSVTLPFGEMANSEFVKVAATDLLTHSWDIARATGQSTDLAPDLAQRLLDNAQTFVTPAFRGPDGVAFFADAHDVPEGSGAADRLAAFLGRLV